MKKLLFLALPILMLSCSSGDDNANVPVIPSPAAGVAYFRANVNGVPTDYTYNYTSATTAYGFSNSASGSPGGMVFSYGGSLSTASFSPTFTVYFDNMYVGGYEDESDNFYNTFATLPTNYLTNAQIDSYVKGIEIDYEKNGNRYNSGYGSQAGSTFAITSATQGIEAGGSLKVKTVIGTLACKLYNVDDVTDIITLSNGSFKVIVREEY